MDVMCIFLPRDDDCFRPARIMEGGQMFEFGGMCRELMDRVAPTAFSLSAQQMQSTGDQHIPSHFNSSWLQLSLCYTFILYWSWSFAMHKKNRLLSEFQIPLCKGCMSKGLTLLPSLQDTAFPTLCVRSVTCSSPLTLRPSCTTTASLTSAGWDSSKLVRRSSGHQVRYPVYQSGSADYHCKYRR